MSTHTHSHRFLFAGYTYDQEQLFQQRREEFRAQLIREAVAEGLIEAKDFDIKTLM